MEFPFKGFCHVLTYCFMNKQIYYDFFGGIIVTFIYGL